MPKTKTTTIPSDNHIELVDDELVTVTGGLLPWEARPAMSSVGTGYGAWEQAMKARGLLN